MALSFAAEHLVFLIEFYVKEVWELFYYNIFSVVLFTGLTLFCVTAKKMNFMAIDTLMALEIAVHQVFAVLLLGPESGFQYILLAMAIPFVFYSYSTKFYILSTFKALLGFIAFIALDLLFKSGFQPIYSFDDTKWLSHNTLFVVFCTFITLSVGTFASFLQNKRKLAKEYEFHKKTIEKQMRAQENIIKTIANMVEARDKDTGKHTERTSLYVLQILDGIKHLPKYEEELTEDHIAEIVSAATLHDIGKICIPDNILNKPEKLTPEEYDIIKSHTIEGAKLLDMCQDSIDNQTYFTTARNIALYHHERYDGTGYPEQLKGDDIPLEARVMAIADAYDALYSQRPYKRALSNEEVIEILQFDRGSHFDPEILDSFISQLGQH